MRAVRAFGDLTGIGPSNTAYTVKRVIGLPGQTVACCSADGRVTVDGTPLDEPYVYEDLPFTAGTLDCSSSPRSTRCFPEITVPEDNLLVLGDHRSESADSVIGCRGATEGPECARFVPLDRVVGPVVLRFWPLDRRRRHRRTDPDVGRGAEWLPGQPSPHSPRLRRSRRRRGCAGRRRW